MLYTIRSINQKAIIDSGLGIDLVDSTIITWFNDFKGLHTTKVKLDKDGQAYYWISYSFIIDELPLLGLKSKDSIYRRIKKLVELKIIVPHPDNQ